MTIPQRFTTGDATFYVLVVSDDKGTADDEGGDAIVWEHPFPEGTELRDVLKRQRSLDGRYGISWIAECRIIPETRFAIEPVAAVKESLTVAPAPAGGLVERVMLGGGLSHTEARAAILAAADYMDNHDWPNAARWLREDVQRHG
jgi:hypothetical protein